MVPIVLRINIYIVNVDTSAAARTKKENPHKFNI